MYDKVTGERLGLETFLYPSEGIMLCRGQGSIAKQCAQRVFSLLVV